MKAGIATSLFGAVLLVQAAPASASATAVCAAPIPGPSLERIRAVVSLGAAGWLVDARAGAFYLTADGTRLASLEGNVSGHIDDVLPAGPDAAIVLTSPQAAASGGTFRIDLKDLKVRELSGSEPLKVTLSGKLPNGGALLGTARGLFRIEGGQQLRDLSRPGMGAVTVLQQTDDSTWLVGAQNGLYRFDAKTSRVDAVTGGDFGAVTDLSRMADGGWLVAADRGLFRTDPAGRSASAVVLRKPGRILGTHKLADGTWLIRSESGLSLVDPEGRKAETISDEPGSGWKIFRADSAGVLLGSERLLYSLQPSSKRIEVISGEAGTDIYSTQEVPGGWLISGRRGLFRIEHPRFKLSAVKGPAPGRIDVLQPLAAGGFLIQASNGLFRTDAALQKIESVPGPNTGSVQAFARLKSGGSLVGAERGLFWADSEGRKLSPVAESNLSEVTGLYPLGSGEWLAFGEGTAVVVDASGQNAAKIAGIGAGTLQSILSVPGAGAMAVGSKEILRLSSDLNGARLELDPASGLGAAWRNRETSTVAMTLRHSCAALAQNLGLRLEARPAGMPEASPRVLGISWQDIRPDAAGLTTDLSALPAGRWTLRLASEGGAQSGFVGEPLTLAHEETALGWLRGNSLVLLASAAGLHFVIVLATFLFARGNPRLLRGLRHPIWATLAIWPSILFRSSKRARLWVLAPWFKAVRVATPSETAFLDVEVGGPDDTTGAVSAVLSRARTTQRIWLQGRPGTGKTEAVAAWKRAFFAGHHSLEAAMGANGFLLVPVPRRLRAEAAERSSGPDGVVESAVLDAFERMGLDMDSRFLRLMIRRSRVVLLLDQVSEAERDGPIAALVRRYPAARFLIASDADAPEGFETWRLRASPTRESTEALLRLWLGAYSGSRLATRVVREGLEPHLTSAHDVRLVADLVTDDPDLPLPADRAGLYQGVLERVRKAGVPPAAVSELKAIAWTATLDGRHDLRPEHLAALGPDALAGLLKARLLREEDGIWTFRHDLLRLFVAACWLVENRRDAHALIKELQSSRIWQRSRAEQEELWRFVVQLLRTEDVTALWPFGLEEPKRVYLVAALYGRARAANLFPLGLSAATNSPIAHLSRRRAAHAMVSVPASTAS
jgi:hypothetical protein